MSNEERDMILQMLATNKIDTGEAAELLDALSSSQRADEDEEAVSNAPAVRHHRSSDWSRRDPANRGLLIRVTDNGETRTRIHVPLAMALVAGKFIPKRMYEYFDQHGISLREVIDNIGTDPERQGEIVDVNDGTTRVQIVVTG